MIMNTNQIITMTEANQNFSKVVKATEKNGSTVIFKNNKPSYLLVDLKQTTFLDLSDDEKIDIIAKRVLDRYREAFKELAK